MPYDIKLSNRIREALEPVKNVKEKEMFGGVCFMVNDRMCVGVVKDEMMCRIDPAVYGGSLEKNGCREMIFTGRPMKGYVFISDEGMRSKKEFEYWISLCLDFNSRAKASKKKTKSR